MWRRNARECGVHFRQSMRGTTGNIWRTTLIETEALGVMGVIRQKNRKQNRGVEEQFHPDKVPSIVSSRSWRI